MATTYSHAAPQRTEIDAMRGPAVVEFGANGCGYCQAAQPAIEAAFAGHSQIPHLKIEDGKGKVLGRTFQVKLWPTLIFLDDGKEVARVVRPKDAASISAALAQLEA
jgi:thioredoxin 1